MIEKLVTDYPREVIDEGWMRSDLTDYQVYAFNALLKLRGREVLGLQDFPIRYPTYGSDHAICEYMTYLKVDEGHDFIYVFENDLRGLCGTGEVSRPDAGKHADRLYSSYIDTSGVVYFKPIGSGWKRVSGRDHTSLLDAGHRVVYDFAYLGTTAPREFDLQHEGIDAAFVSLSKPYGLFSHRIGLSFFRKSIPSLIANQLWPKNIFGLTLAARVLEDIDAPTYARKYKERQSAIVNTLREESGLPLLPSDAFLLAHINEADSQTLTPDQRTTLQRYKRSRGYRFCLTPFFAEHP